MASWLRRKSSPYDLAAFHRQLGVPAGREDDASVARPVMAAYAAVYTDYEMLFDLPGDLDPALRPVFGSSSILEGDFTLRLQEAVIRAAPETAYAREELQTRWGGIVGRLAAEDPAVWDEIRRSREDRPWVDVNDDRVRFGDDLEERCALRIGTVLDIEPGMAALGGVDTMVDGLHKQRPRPKFRYWVVTRHSFIAQMAWTMFTRLLVKETYEEKGLLLADLARQNEDFASLHGEPADVLTRLAGRHADGLPVAQLIIWTGPTLLAATDDVVLDVVDLAHRLLSPGGAMLLGVPADEAGAEPRLARVRAERSRSFAIKAPAGGAAAAYSYLWMTRL